MEISLTTTDEDIRTVRDLFIEYSNTIEVDLCFQNFKQELADLPGQYAAPDGLLFLARCDQKVAGCVALRKLEAGTCEMKRLYVRPAFRRHGLGRRLATTAIEVARDLGCTRMRLDTLFSMKEAIAMYESLGFRRIPPYYDNPNERALFMELQLRMSGKVLF
jgi:putative acetyltransferase